MTTLIHLLFITFIIAVTIIISIFIYRDTKQTEAKLKENKKQQKKDNIRVVTDPEEIIKILSKSEIRKKILKFVKTKNT
jgi:uncharacterized protein YneF (UPF0154 family)